MSAKKVVKSNMKKEKKAIWSKKRAKEDSDSLFLIERSYFLVTSASKSKII